MECWSRMPDFDDLDARIEALCARATSPHPDARLVVEIEDLLAEGYVCALRGDRLTRNLQLRFEELVDSEESAEQLRCLAREQRVVTDATRELRAKLATMREHWVALGSKRIGLA